MGPLWHFHKRSSHSSGGVGCGFFPQANSCLSTFKGPEQSFPARALLPFTYQTHLRTWGCPSEDHTWICSLPFQSPPWLCYLPFSGPSSSQHCKTQTSLTSPPSITATSTPSIFSSADSWAAPLYRTEICSPQSSCSEKLLYLAALGLSPFKGLSPHALGTDPLQGLLPSGLCSPCGAKTHHL